MMDSKYQSTSKIFRRPESTHNVMGFVEGLENAQSALGVEVKQTRFKLSELSRSFQRSMQCSITDIHEAVRGGYIQVVEQAITKAKQNKSLNKLDDSGFAALHHAVRYNRIEAVRKLLESGAKVDVPSAEESTTPLHIASRFGWSEATELLLDHGASPNVPNTNGSTALHFACRRKHKSVVALLLNARKVDVDAKDKSLMTALHFACLVGDEQLCSMLLEKNADYEVEAMDKMTPLHCAVASCNTAAAKVILDRAVKTKSKLISLLQSRDIDSNTVLHLTAVTNDLEVAQIVISHGADVNAHKTNFATPLHLASAKGNTELAELFIGKGADIGAQDTEGRSPLHMAASFNHVETIKLLLNKGAPVDANDYSNRTPFLAAIASGKTTSGQLLVDRGADILAFEAHMKNCVHLAVENENLETLRMILEKEGALENLCRPDVEERVPLHYAAMCSDIKILQAILHKQPRLTFQDDCQRTPLHLAAESGRTEHAQALAHAGSALNERDDEGRTALHLAAMNGNRKVCAKLIRLGADVNCRNNNRWTPLMFAAKTGSVKTCEELLDHNASIDDVNLSGDTALLLATCSGHVIVVKMLLDSGASVVHRNNCEFGVIDVAVKWGAGHVAMAVCNHERWQEVLDLTGPDGHSPMKLLIQYFPDAAKIVLDKCVQQTTHVNPTDPEYTVTCDFSLLDPGPDDPAFIRGNRYFGPLTMVQFNRQELLNHSLTQKLLERKWSSFGKFAFYFSFFIYIAFTLCFTIFLIKERERLDFLKIKGNATRQPKFYYSGESGFTQNLPYIILVFAVTHILKEFFQLAVQGRFYFMQFTNLMEWVLYATAVVFMVPYVASESWVNEILGTLSKPGRLWVNGVISIFLCYMNLVLFFRRFRILGIYVSMFVVVLRTVCKVMVVFVVFIFAFAVVFYILFKQQDSFQSIGHSFLKVVVMMVGEMDYASTFVTTVGKQKTATGNPMNPFPETADVFCYVFLFVMALALMNLLVGLAVGDIDAIQRDASMKLLAMEVEFVAQIEDRYPRFITRIVYNPVIEVKPNQLSLIERIIQPFLSSSQKTTIKTEDPQDETDQSIDLYTKVTKANKRLKSLALVAASQNRLLDAMTKTIMTGEAWVRPKITLVKEQQTGSDGDTIGTSNARGLGEVNVSIEDPSMNATLF